ncbi:MAG: LacI family DNA-binding transcriptional regulator [Clostridia bacterium]|nr:LacI family DNA-binding transcriptional regulator [Clostridia bacterium]
MTVTIRDVASKAGVSASTVSRVLSKSPRISEETRKTVLRAIRELGYHPNTMARSLAGGKSNAIGLVLPASPDTLMDNGFFIRAMTGVALCAQENGFHVMFSFSKSADEALELTQGYVRGQSVDGVILFFSRKHDPCMDYLKKAGVPFSVIGKPDEEEDCCWVDNDNRQATLRAAEYLIARGHTQIAYLCGPEDYNVSSNRLDGFRRAMEDAVLPIEESLIVKNGQFTSEWGREAVRSLIKSRAAGGKFPTAIMACDDMQAIGALEAVRGAGIEGVSVIGFNNIPISAYTSPALTTIDVNAEKLGENAAGLLIEALHGDRGTFRHVIVRSTLVERSSVAVLGQEGERGTDLNGIPGI